MTHTLGQTGLRVSPLGFGAMHFDSLEDEAEVGRLLGGVLDLGLSLIDTARGYGRSEERIGRHLAHRRHEFVLSTKFGYGVDGIPDWTYDCIVHGVERTLRLMRTEVIDIGHLHSCPLEVLERGEVSRALQDCVRAGKLRVAAYSGENAELAHALADPGMGSVQCSLGLVDRANASLIGDTHKGVIIKRALGGRPWARARRPDDFCEGQYWDRWQALALPPEALDQLDWDELALRWVAEQPGVDALLLGSRSLGHLAQAQAALAKGPLPTDLREALDAAWQPLGCRWPGLI
ncbi:aryl-alcohol dehydrogenase-like predicted oxidoreductase [Inhella inkyongensis]|uniref:Aryl-alcohol dehydrogenase-like predicted oxidoreductase n=1 Tax=Inhella inkyongensis TaxID=392593 RepID=A0A840S4G1_9BURK|nr:aldo/keto reductase [Inhella inkyongensis]MBB5206177.1 aryl-alcohol dehydrogenase-like predicted oxidoreductase [Inhella inkyongensis]